ncbi:hypothetical protein Pmani_012598 [Petrolisthes manimaculis]|uniref:Major facilitator superfamily (MFS) profile domain-containing protein n=1 Tax=Petrolisthes manimaculis TaxID=1843537 RepID=A0AAE1UD15_9EUCA|nr:hypothetical protein Pmani_012598 [Petrolisthes manimaculis]
MECERKIVVNCNIDEVIVIESDETENLIEKGQKLAENNPRLTENNPRLTENNPRLAENNPRLVENNPRLTENNLRLTENNLRLTENNPRLAENNPRLTENNPRLTENNPRLAENNPRLTENNPRLVENNPRLTENNPRLAENNPRLTENNPRLAENNPRLTENNPRLTENNPRLTENNPRLTENNPRLTENNPRLAENNPRLVENKPRLTENNPKLAENNPRLAENNPRLTKNNPRLVENDTLGNFNVDESGKLRSQSNINKISTTIHQQTDHQDNTKDDCNESDNNVVIVMVAPDGGWGWMVTVGCFIISMLLPMLGPCFGILYSEILIDLGASSLSVAWTFNLFMVMWKVTTVFLAPIGKEMGVRPVAIMGGLISALGIMVTAFANSVFTLILSFSILAGFGSSLSMGSCFPILATYFNKRRGLANAFLMAGISIGQLVNAPLIRYLQEEYSNFGAILIVGAILLHTCAGAALLQPVQWYLKPIHVPISEMDPNELNQLNPVTTTTTTTTTDFKHSGVCNTLGRIMIGTIRDLQILKQRRALLIALIGAFSLNSHFNFIAMVPFAMQDAGHSLSWAAWVVSATALTNTLARILVSIMADHPRFPLRAVYIFGNITITLSIIGWTLMMKETWPGMVVMAMFGCGVGIVMGLHNLAMVQIVGVANIKAMFAVNNVMVGLGFIIIGPFVGIVRDMTESYAVSMCVLAGVMFVCVLLWCLMPAAVARDIRNAKSNNS